MKRILLLAFVSLWANSNIFSQNIGFYLIKENVETIMKNPNLITCDPQVLDYSFDFLGSMEFLDTPRKGDEQGLASGFLDNFNLYGEMVVTPGSIMLRLPIRYTLGNFRLSLTLPYYFSRSMNYTHGTVSAYGLGDIQSAVTYRLKGKNFQSEFIVDAKLPTGNHNKLVKGYLVPLGTGSYDFSAGNSSQYTINKLSFLGNVHYRVSGAHQRLVEITYNDFDGTELINYSITNGNTFIANLTGRYKLGYGLSVMAGVNAINNGSGSFSRKHSYSWDEPDKEFLNQNAHQDFTYVDLSVALAYNIYGFYLFANFRPPLYTLYNQLNTEQKRDPIFYFKLSRKLF